MIRAVIVRGIAQLFERVSLPFPDRYILIYIHRL